MKKPTRNRNRLSQQIERQVLAYGLRDFRYGQLLSPEETNELADEIGSSNLQGWTLRSALTGEEVDWLSKLKNSILLITTRTVCRDLLLVVLSMQINGVQFRWGVPIWEIGARDWLRQVSEEKSITWVVQSVNNDQGAVQFSNTFNDETAQALLNLLTDTSVLEETQETRFEQFVQAGMELMLDDPQVYGEEGETTEDLRILLMVRQQDAHCLVKLLHQAADDAQAEMRQCLSSLYGWGKLGSAGTR
jgi:hypothetical protein